MNKITEQELEKLNKLRTDSADITYNLGVLEIHLNQTKTKKEILMTEYTQVEIEFKQHSKLLKEKYGDGELDLLTGEIKV
jgi:hypothetical protein